jgi:hypothetical protein
MPSSSFISQHSLSRFKEPRLFKHSSLDQKNHVCVCVCVCVCVWRMYFHGSVLHVTYFHKLNAEDHITIIGPTSITTAEWAKMSTNPETRDPWRSAIDKEASKALLRRD